MSNHKMLIILVFLLFLLPQGCSDSDDPVDEQPLQIPPESTMITDFSDFSQSMAASTHDNSPQTLTRQNWGWAATNVLYWNSVLTVALIVPAAAFAESFHHEPVQQTDGTWVWSYNFHAGGVLHVAELHGKRTGETVDWDMYISKQGFYTDFNWFSGECNMGVTTGTWTLYKEPNNPVPFIGIEWHRNPVNETGDIKYTHIEPDVANHGGYIFYGATNLTPYNSFYDIYNKVEENLTNIEMNRTTKEGRVKDPAHFNNELWHCWNSILEDIDCP